MNRRTQVLSVALVAFAAPFGVSHAAHADVPGRHPHYLEATADLRAARGLLERRPGNAGVQDNEGMAIDEIDAALRDLHTAAIEDDKNVRAHEDAKYSSDHEGKLREAQHLLRDAVEEANHGETEISARPLRDDALGHIRAAAVATDRAIHDAKR